jgi:hypothetical protein
MAASLKDDVINILDQLPQEQLTEVLDFAMFVKSRTQNSTSQRIVAKNVDTLQSMPAHSIDVVEDADRLYYGRH